jgi:glutathione peroxidase
VTNTNSYRARMSFAEFEMQSITGDQVNFSQFQGQVSLVVNVASAWGLTPQYAGLRALQEQHGGQGFNVLAFPCNQFAGQEPGTNAEILEFATSGYDINFPMFAKIDVNGDDAAPLYDWLRAEQPGEGDSADITWNFEKFLVDRSGQVVARWAPQTTPEQIGEQLSTWL